MLKRELVGFTLPLDEVLTKLEGVMGTLTKEHFTSAFQSMLQCSKSRIILSVGWLKEVRKHIFLYLVPFLFNSAIAL
jgi:hypothetical protein